VTGRSGWGDSVNDDGGTGQDTVHELTARLRALREQRIADDREGDLLEVYLRGIALARRDRDAGISPEIQSCRSGVEQAMAAAEELAVAQARLWTRVQVAQLGEADPRMRAAQRASEKAFRDALTAFADALNGDEQA
jgi:hypothetical protein